MERDKTEAMNLGPAFPEEPPERCGTHQATQVAVLGVFPVLRLSAADRLQGTQVAAADCSASQLKLVKASKSSKRVQLNLLEIVKK